MQPLQHINPVRLFSGDETDALVAAYVFGFDVEMAHDESGEFPAGFIDDNGCCYGSTSDLNYSTDRIAALNVLEHLELRYLGLITYQIQRKGHNPASFVVSIQRAPSGSARGVQSSAAAAWPLPLSICRAALLFIQRTEIHDGI